MQIINNLKSIFNIKAFLFKISSFVLVFLVLDFIISLVLLEGLNKYYGIGETSEIALVGHSHLMLGIDKKIIEDKLNIEVSKYTREGVNVYDRKLMIEQLLSNNTNLKTVIYGVDAWSFTGEGLSENSYKLFYPFMNNPNINNYIYNNSDIGDYLTKKIIRTSRFNEQLLVGSLRGFLGKWDNLKFGNVNITKLKNVIDNNDYRKINNSANNIKIFKETIALLLENNIDVILLYVPTVDLLGEIQPNEYQETIDVIIKLSDEFENVKFISFQEPWSHNYSIFYDPIHLNPIGQKIITNEFITYLEGNTYKKNH